MSYIDVMRSGKENFTYFVRGSIIVWLTPCLTGLDTVVLLRWYLRVWSNPNQLNKCCYKSRQIICTFMGYCEKQQHFLNKKAEVRLFEKLVFFLFKNLDLSILLPRTVFRSTGKLSKLILQKINFQ